MKNRGVLKSEIRSDGKLSITITEGDIWMTRTEICEFLSISSQNFTGNKRAIFNNGELHWEIVCRRNDKNTLLYSLDLVLALVFRCKGGYCRSIRQWIGQRIQKPIIEHRQPIIITLGKGGALS